MEIIFSNVIESKEFEYPSIVFWVYFNKQLIIISLFPTKM